MAIKDLIKLTNLNLKYLYIKSPPAMTQINDKKLKENPFENKVALYSGLSNLNLKYKA